MCGRLCMSLQPSALIEACEAGINTKIQSSSPKAKQDPEISPSAGSNNQNLELRKEFNLGRSFEPSFNICPGDLSFIIVSTKKFNVNAKSTDRTIIPALWGLIPHWHRGNYKKHGLTTHNVRLESCLSPYNSYKCLVDNGKRCVVPIEGYYEWREDSFKMTTKQVYFVHNTQYVGVKIEDDTDDNMQSFPKLMYLAGIYDIWRDERNNSIYSFSILTTNSDFYESESKLKWLNDRIPIVLESEKDIETWVNYEDYDADIAMKSMKVPNDDVSFYEVSNYVNDGRKKSEQCVTPKPVTNRLAQKFINC